MVEISAKWFYENYGTLTYYAGTYIHIYSVEEDTIEYSAYPNSFTIGSGETKSISLAAEDWMSGDSDYRTGYVYGQPLPTYTHTITYNANGGSGSMSSTTITDNNSGNSNVTFASCGFSRTGYHFSGWKIDNTGTLYQPNDTYSVGGNATVVAYAQWIQDIAEIPVKDNGTWKNCKVRAKVSGVWKDIKKVFVKVSGIWKECR